VPVEDSTSGNRQAIDLGPVLGIEQHAVDLQFVDIVLLPAAFFAGERDDVAGIPGVVEHDGEMRAALLAMKIGHRLAAEIAAGDFNVVHRPEMCAYMSISGSSRSVAPRQ